MLLECNFCHGELDEQKQALRCCKNVVCDKCFISHIKTSQKCPICNTLVDNGKVKPSYTNLHLFLKFIYWLYDKDRPQ